MTVPEPDHRPSTPSPTASGRRPRAQPDDRHVLRRRSLRRPPRGPGPGRPRRGARARWSAPRAEAQAIRPTGLPTEDRITRDMLKVIARARGSRRTTSALHQLRVVDQMGGPQQLLPQLDPVPARRHARAARGFLARLAPTRRSWPPTPSSCARASRSGLTAPRIVTERTIAQIERMLAIPIDQAIVPSMAQVASDADRERVRDVVRDVVYPADQAFLDALRGDYLGGQPRGAGPVVGARTASALPDRDPQPGRRSTSTPQDVHRIGLEELESIEAERRVIARAAGFGDDTAAYRASLAADAGEHRRRPRTSSSRARRRTSSGRWPSRRATSAGCRRAGCEVRAGRGVQGEGRAVRVLLPAVARRLAARHLLRQRLRPAVAQVHQARHDDLPRGRARPPLPDRARDGEPAPQHVPPPRRRGSSAAPTSRAGACTASGSPTRWACSATRRERFGMLDAQAWRAARLVVDTGLHALRWTRQRSIDFLLETPACPTPTPRSRPTATSAGRARP